MKPDRVGLWIYELCVKLSNDLPYMLDLCLHDSIGTIGETTPMSDVVAHWGCIIHSFNVGRMTHTERFKACDYYNLQIKSRMWPHKHGGREHLYKSS